MDARLPCALSQHQPVLETYAELRSVPNICLVAGGGIGDGPSAWRWVSGQWSTELGYPAMPFDGVLIGSRVMVAAEAATETAVKEVLAGLPGVQDAEWEKSFDSSLDRGAGGVITVNSEVRIISHSKFIHRIIN